MTRWVKAVLGAAVLAAVLAWPLGVALAQGPAPGGPGGPGMMGGWPGGQFFGPGGGMMGGMMPGMMGAWGWGLPAAQQPLTLEQARDALQAYLDRLGNPDLALQEVMEFQWNFYAIVKEQSTGRGAIELLVDKRTGAIFPEYGPAMMWNTRYGHMGGWGMMGFWGLGAPSVERAVTPEQATAIAREWLARYLPGTSVKEPMAFYGYYTLDTVKDGKVTGMLSVNAYTGQVWYHTWHGEFIGEWEAGP